MGSFDPTKCFNSEGTIRLNTDTDIVDTFGTIRGSDQFDGSKVVDIYGNLGSVPAAGPWEIQVGSVETVGSHLSRNATAYVTPISAYASQGCTGYIDGIISGGAALTIQSSPQTIDGISYPGCGLLVIGVNNTLSTTTMQTGTKLQLGELTGTTGSIRDVSLATGAVLDIYGANTTRFNKVFIVTNNAGGIVNWKGPGVDGQGILGNQNTYTNNGVTNIDDGEWALGVGLAGAGTINVLDGGTFFNNGIQNVGSTNKFFINGCGWKSAAGVAQGAISVNSNTDFFPAIHVQSASCLKVHTNGTTVWRGALTGSAPLTLSSLGAGVNGAHQFINTTANTYNGTMTVDATSLSNGPNSNTLQFAKVVLVNGGRIGTNSNTGQTIGSLASTDPTTYWQSGDPVNNTIKNNGITTYAGRLLWTGGLYAANYFFDGPSSNQLTLTSTGNTGNIYPRNGFKLTLQGATCTNISGAGGQVRAQTGATVSAGTSITASVSYLYIDATSKLEVKAAGAGTSLITATLGFVPSVGWQVDLPDALPAGTHTFLKYSGTATATLPTIGANLSGRTVTGFAYNNATNPKTLSVTLV